MYFVCILTLCLGSHAGRAMYDMKENMKDTNRTEENYNFLHRTGGVIEWPVEYAQVGKVDKIGMRSHTHGRYVGRDLCLHRRTFSWCLKTT